jgi:hypothetical protein
LGFLAAGQAWASFHLMQIEQVIGGVNGDVTAQAIQLRMRSGGQNLLSPARIRVFDAAGANPIVIYNFTAGNFTVGSGTGRRILLVSPNFPMHTTPAAVDDVSGMVNLIPASYLAAGSLTFETDAGTSVYWRLSWGGAGYTGSCTGVSIGGNDADGNFCPPFPGPLPSNGAQALFFDGGPCGVSCDPSTNNAADYILTPGAAVFINNAAVPGMFTVNTCTTFSLSEETTRGGGEACNDANECTDDICSGVSCSFPPFPAGTMCGSASSGECDDPDTCDGAGSCDANNIAGPCTDDGNPCTDDLCAGGACTHPNDNTNACDDGMFCTATDSCSAGACTGSGNPCSGATPFCDEDANMCVACTMDSHCDDGNDCTSDACIGGMCDSMDESAGTPCGSASSGECDNADTCDGAGACQANHKAGPCTDDGNPCTDDVCAGGDCTHPNDDSNACTDGLFCTGPDSCVSGSCVPSGDPCMAGEVCDEDTDSCVSAPIRIQLLEVSAGLSSPVMLTHANDGTNRLFVADQAGSIRVIDGGVTRGKPFLDLTDKIPALNPLFDERGLLGVAFHPDYVANGRFFVRYSRPWFAENACNCPADCGVDASETPGGTCDDALDNDCDGKIDCADLDCAGESKCACTVDAVCGPGESPCTCPADCGLSPAAEMPGATCADDVDNDCDGVDDCDDPDCTADASCPCGDATCAGGENSCNCPADCGMPAADENSVRACTDFLDNDCDGSADCLDADCSGSVACRCGDGTCDAGGPCATDSFIRGCHSEVLAQYMVSMADPNAADPMSEVILFAVDKPQWNHNAGGINFGPGGYLFFSLGDGGGANDGISDGNPPGAMPSHGPIGSGQDTFTPLGKLLRVDVGSGATLPDDFPGDPNRNYAIPSTNPFADGMDGLPEIYAYGFRNPYRFSFDRATSDLYLGDVGQDIYEEINVVALGGNYGWAAREGAHFFDPFNPGTTPASCVQLFVDAGIDCNSLIDPVSEYTHVEGGLAVVGGYVYRGVLSPGLEGIYVYGDFSADFGPTGRLYYFTTTGPNAFQRVQFVIGPEDVPFGKVLKGFGEDEEGELYALGTDDLGPSRSATGVVYRIEECFLVRFGDLVEPFGFPPDVDDLVRMVAGFANPNAFPETDIWPCEPDFVCESDAECEAVFPPGTQCLNGRCIVVDVDDIVAIVAAFAGMELCPERCL